MSKGANGARVPLPVTDVDAVASVTNIACAGDVDAAASVTNLTCAGGRLISFAPSRRGRPIQNQRKAGTPIVRRLIQVSLAQPVAACDG
jgi:hypothetical protein